MLSITLSEINIIRVVRLEKYLCKVSFKAWFDEGHHTRVRCFSSSSTIHVTTSFEPVWRKDQSAQRGSFHLLAKTALI